MHHVANRRSESASQSPHQKFSPTTDDPSRKSEVFASPELGLDLVLVNQRQHQASDEQLCGPQPPTSHSSPLSSSLTSNNNKRAVESSEPGSSNSSHGGLRVRSRRVFNFTTSALGVQRFRRLALNNKRLLRKYGVTSIQIKDTFNGEATQHFDLPKRCPPSPLLNKSLRYKLPPKPTQFASLAQTLARGGLASTQLTNRSNKLAALSVAQPISSKVTSLSMEQRAAAVPQQLNRIPSQQMVGQSMQQESNITETPLLMNLLSANSNQQQQISNNGMPPQVQPSLHQPQQINPGMMRYPTQQLQSPMYLGPQQSPQYMQGRMQGHPMMMSQQMASASGMPGQNPQFNGPPAMPPPVAQAPEQPKKRKRQTKKQKEEESKKQQQQSQNATQMHPMTAQAGMPQQMHPDFYMMQNQSGQQRVPPMHMAPSQMQQYRSMSYPAYGQHPQHYGQSSASMMGTPPQYPGQQSYPQQMWNPNMPQQHHMAQQSDYHMQMQRGQMPQQTAANSGANLHHYPAPQQSPVPDLKNRIPPPSYNDSMQYVQQQRQPSSFMSPPPGQASNYTIQSQQMMQSAQYHAQLHHQRVINDISENVDEIMATIGGDGAEDFDLDSIELEPMRGDGNEIGGIQQTQSVSTPQQGQQTPAHYYQQQPQSMPPNYGNMYESPSSQQFAQQSQGSQPNYQIHPNMMAHQQMPTHSISQQAMPPPVPQKSAEKNREQQQKLEQKQLEAAMCRSPHAPHSPTSVEVPIQQQQRVATAIDSVMEKVMSGKNIDESGASTSSQPTPPPSKRKKASAKQSSRAQQQQIPAQAMPPQHGQFTGQVPQMNIYGNGQHPTTPTQFNNSQQQQSFYYHQQRMQQMHMRQMSYPGQQSGGPSTPLSAPPVSTPDQQYFYGQQGILSQHSGNGTPSRTNSFKNIMPKNDVSNPHTPQTPNQQTPQQMSQKMFNQENGGGTSSATSSAAATPSSSSQHRASIDEQSQAPHGFSSREEQQFSTQYAQYNGHTTQHFMFSQQSCEEPTDSNSEAKTTNSAVSLKSQIGELNAPSTKTPPSANSGISSATPTTASQFNHLGDNMPKNEPQQMELAPIPMKHELNDSVDNIKEELLSPNHTEDRFDIKNELNGPTNTAPSTSTVAE